ncbi:winged helix-turn-helix transcriptional regulator [Streptomyces erythrochromogenes]|uniref:winged helix-turn-helix transcriptional regulator n=1 Tax=Streptomyces erythrochromogenes TaxID=285574 RepID=UPI00367F28F4
MDIAVVVPPRLRLGNEDQYDRRLLRRVRIASATDIVGLVLEGTLRYTELSRRIEGVSQKMLTQTLRGLEAGGFVARTVHPTVPPRVEYDLTELGRSLAEPITALRQWTETHINEIERARPEPRRRPGKPPETTERRRGVGPWPTPLPTGDHAPGSATSGVAPDGARWYQLQPLVEPQPSQM